MSTFASAAKPRFLSVHEIHATPQAVADALKDEFSIVGRPIALRPPIDWQQDPHGDRTWRFWLHSLVVLEPLLQHYDRTGDLAALGKAVAVARDWIEQNPEDGVGISEFAWSDMTVAARAAFLSYVDRALAHENRASTRDFELVHEAVLAHARWLAEEANYTEAHNHGLYQDAGLGIVAAQLGSHPSAADWSRIADERFLRTTRATVHWEEAVHLEHSPAYHGIVTHLIGRLSSALGIGGAALRRLHERMAANAAWFVMPDGRYPQLGDTDLKPAPAWVMEHDAAARGFRVFPGSGAAVYRDARSYLMFVAWYHGSGHKHSDELSFVWAESGRRILVDTGRYGYYYDEPGRVFAESSASHNTLTLDAPFTWRGRPAYGSGIRHHGFHDGAYFVSAVNPLLEPEGVAHRRTLVYRPSEWLLVVDDLESRECPRTTRRFHFAPAFRLAPPDGHGRLRAEDPEGAVWLIDAPRRDDTRVERIRGRREPGLQGFTFPSSREWVANDVVELHAAACRGPLVAALVVAPRDEAPMLDVAVGEDSGLEVGVLRADGASRIRISGDRARVGSGSRGR